jgi:hypothetical protein
MDNWKTGSSTILQALGLNWKVKYPKLITSLASQAQQATLSQNAKTAVTQSGGTIPGNISTKGATGIKGLYNALTSAGASPNQAIGMIANAINESSLNPETRVIDSNGYYSNGLWQFNEATYPDSYTLVTGNPAKDMIAQIQYLFQVGGLRAASGSTPQSVAGNFAANFEECGGCQPGGAQYNARIGNVASVMQALG